MCLSHVHQALILTPLLKLLTDYSDLLLTDLDPAAFVHLVNAFFASVAGKGTYM